MGQSILPDYPACRAALQVPLSKADIIGEAFRHTIRRPVFAAGVDLKSRLVR